MFSMSIRLSGISRWQITRGRRSLSVTIAARVSRFEPAPVAIAPRLVEEQGTTAIPSCRNDPDAITAPTSLLGWKITRSSNALAAGDDARLGHSSSSVGFLTPSSSNSRRWPYSLMTACTVAPLISICSSVRTA